MLQKTAAALFLLIAGGVGAQEMTYTLEQCVQEALRNNPAAGIAKDAEAAALEDVASAEGRYYPEVGVQSAYRRFETHAFLPSDLAPITGIPSTVVGPLNDWRLNVSANYVVYDSGLRSSDLNSAKSQLSAAREEAGRTRADIVYNVHVGYFDVLQAQAALRSAKDRQSRSREHVKLAEARKAEGAVPQADVTLSRTDASSADLDVASAENTLRVAQGKLNQAMGHPPNESFALAEAPATDLDPAQIQVQQYLDKAMESRPEVVAAQKRAEARRSQIGAVRSEILPKVRAEAGYGWRDDDFDPPDKDWWVGVSLNIPLFDGGVRNQSHREKQDRSRSRGTNRSRKSNCRCNKKYGPRIQRWVEAFQALQTSGVMKEQAAESARSRQSPIRRRRRNHQRSAGCRTRPGAIRNATEQRAISFADHALRFPPRRRPIVGALQFPQSSRSSSGPAGILSRFGWLNTTNRSALASNAAVHFNRGRSALWEQSIRSAEDTMADLHQTLPMP